VNYERQFLEHLDLIDQIARASGRRRHLAPEERDDLKGFIRLRLIEDNYAILRKFKNRSSFHTYLIAVIERLSLDYCIEQWGKWRPTATAQRLGDAAILLERLVVRDGRAVEEAIEMMLSSHEITASAAELRAMWKKLPSRVRPQQVAESAALGVPALDRAEQGVEDDARRTDLAKIEDALKTALSNCTDQDRVLLALRFDQGLKMADIAQVLGSSSPTLHRRLAKILSDLGAALKSAGVNPSDIGSLIGHGSVHLPPLLGGELERLSKTVRLFKRDE
jgi:RNA polymerase sigma factor for flagellar operon FliA